MDVAVIGGGINGLCCAWKLAQQRQRRVTLYEKGRLMRATSSASSKLLHGGLRYLETGQFRLVREALRERDGWLARCPELTRPLPTIFPVYQDSRRPRWLLGLGLTAYDWLAGKSALPKSRWLSKREVIGRSPALREDGLLGGYLYYDGQMDDYALGLWVAERCREAGVAIEENSPVARVSPGGEVTFPGGSLAAFDRIINVAGPWSQQLLERSDVPISHTLDAVRGSHLEFDLPCPHALILEVPADRRVVFVLPWKNKTLIGTTEVRQLPDDPIVCSAAETTYLLDAYNHYCTPGLHPEQVSSSFAGLRPLLLSGDDPSRATREYAIQRNGKLITVFGGKWTTSMSLAENVTRMVN